MSSKKPILAAATMIMMLIISVPTQAANENFNQAVADYNAGKYGQAASEFESLKASYPANALSRYYLALCRQALGHFDKAKQEYQWVSTNGDARLKALALQGMQRMSGTKSFVTGSPPFSSAQTGTGSQPAAAQQAAQAQSAAKVKTILKFTAPWCGPCQAFQPIFESVKPRFRDVNFEEIDYDTNQDLRAKYGVTAIPHLVLLDANNKVLYSRVGAPRSAESLIRLIKNYH